MDWMITMSISLLILFISLIISVVNHKRKKKKWIQSSLRIFFAGTFLAVSVFYFPLFLNDSPLDGVLLTIHNSMRVFTAGNDSTAVTASDFHTGYHVTRILVFYSAFLYFLSPILSVGFILTFFKNVAAYTKYLVHPKSPVAICSSLSWESLALARSIRKKSRNTLIIFAGAFKGNTDDCSEISRLAIAEGALLFDKDISDFHLNFHSKKSKLQLFFLEKDEDDNVRRALQAVTVFFQRENTEVYVFATSYESELLLDGVEHGRIHKIRRINQRRELVYSNLYRNSIFEQAKEQAIPGNDEKLISILIIGMGQFGTELLKALTWCGQMDGYRIEINVIDRMKDIESRIAALCPELVEKNGDMTPGEANYKIHFYGGVDVDTKEFSDIVLELHQTTGVYVCLGSDKKDIETAIRVRILMTRARYKREQIQKLQENKVPIIYTVVYNSEKCKILGDLKRFGKQELSYHIDYIGKIDECYDIDVIEQAEFDELAKAQHIKWSKNEEEKENMLKNYEQYEYYRRSSLASAIHQKFAATCNQSMEASIEREHKRWNAYMRSEGYVYSGTTDKNTRNDMALLHHDLIPCKHLDEGEVAKDVRMVK